MEVDNYYSIQAVSQSAIKAFLQSPRAYKRFLEGCATATKSMGIGTAIHMAILEPEKFKECYACPEFGKNATAAFKAANLGKEVLSYTDYQKCVDCAAEVKKQAETNPLLKTLFATPHEVEKPYFWTDRDFDIECKAKMDMVATNGTFILDIKTCQDASFEQFPRDFRKYGYGLQAAFYLAGHSANTLPNISEMGVIVPTDYYILAIESSSPHNLCLYKVLPETITRGTELYKDTLDAIKRCGQDFSAGYEYYSHLQTHYEI